MTYPRKKRIDRYGLRLDQVQRVVAICVELESVKMLKQKCRNISLPREAKEEIFFASPLHALHRLLFIAGDIGARAGSLKWTAQIPRKAYRWALRGDLKKLFFGPECERSRGRRTLSHVLTKHEQRVQLRI